MLKIFPYIYNEKHYPISCQLIFQLNYNKNHRYMGINSYLYVFIQITMRFKGNLFNFIFNVNSLRDFNSLHKMT